MSIDTASYWDNRYREGSTGWDIGAPSQPLVEYIDTLQDKSIRILIPGGGYGHELKYLLDKGFTHSYLLDFAPSALQRVKDTHPDIDDKHLLLLDFFAHEQQYDLILEQTFFCALPPDWRPKYAVKMHELLKPGGKLAGVLFSFPLTEEGPPFGGSREEYLGYFEPLFSSVEIAPCETSIKPRLGNEYWIELTK